MAEAFGGRGGPLRRRLRDRYQRRHGLEPPTGLTRGSIELAGVQRTYWLASAPTAHADPAPLLVVLHGGGGQGPGMASLTGLDRRGPAAGFLTVFPDGQGRVWNDSRNAPSLQRRRAVDDVAFLQALVTRLASDHGARAESVYLAGISNGALMSEHVARQGLLPVAGIALVAGAGTQTSRAATPTPVQRATVVIFAGTSDPLVPYAGGPIGPLGRMVQRRAAGTTDRGVAVAAEAVASDWATANGIDDPPSVDALANQAGGLPVTRLAWHAAGPPVVLYRIEGGGHTWPGGAQYLPERLIGLATQTLDATGILLEQFRSQEAAG